MDRRRIEWEMETIDVQEGAPFPLVVRSRFDKQFLRPRAGMASGTTIRFEGDLYELVEKEKIDRTIWYRYEPLGDSQLVRNLYDYSLTNHQCFVQQHKLESAPAVKFARFWERMMWWITVPLVGMTPLETQRAVAERSGMAPHRISLAGGFLSLVFGLIFALLSMFWIAMIVKLTASVMGALVALLIPFYVLVTSAWRIIAALVIQEPTEPVLTAALVRLIRRKRKRD